MVMKGRPIGASVAHALVRAAPRLLSALVGRCYRPSTSAETSGHALRRAMEDENTPNVFSTTCGPLLGDFRGSLGAARMSACATFHPARGGGFRAWRQAGYLAGFLGCLFRKTKAR